MEKRFNTKKEPKKTENPGPVITISRETGCPAERIAKQLALSLNKRKESKSPHWKCVSKEILKESAKELELNPSQIKYVFDFEQRGAWDDIMSSFSTKYYKSDRKIRKTIAEVIRTIAEQGNVIIIGRGSVAITRDMPNAFHVNLEAPLDWRTEMIAIKYNMKPDEARQFAIETDKNRMKFRESFYGRSTDYTRFDVTYNCMTFTDDEIIKSITSLLLIRGMIK